MVSSKHPPVGKKTPVPRAAAQAPAITHAEFIGEELTPLAGTGDVGMMSRGEPGMPRRFLWRGVQFELVGVIDAWKTQGPCRHGSGEMYLRRHWYKVQVRPHQVMTVYCDRQAKDRRKPKSRWWVYTVEPIGEPG